MGSNIIYNDCIVFKTFAQPIHDGEPIFKTFTYKFSTQLTRVAAIGKVNAGSTRREKLASAPIVFVPSNVRGI